MRDHTRAACAAALVLTASIGSMVAAGRQAHSALDGAMVPLRTARNFAQGDGLVFNPGQWVEGFSDPLWTVLLAGLTLLGVDPIQAALGVGVGCLGMLVLLVGWIGTRHLGEGPGVVAAVMVAAWPPMSVAARSLDDVLFVGVLIVWAFGLVLDDRSRTQRSCWGTIALALTAWTGLFGACCAVILALLSRRRLVHVGCVLGALVMLTGIRYALYADPIPAYVRSMPWGGPGRWSVGLEWVLQLFQEAPTVFALGLVGGGFLAVRAKGWRAPVAILGLGLVWCAGMGPARVLLWHPVIPITALVVLMGVGGLAALSRGPMVSRGLLILALVGFAAQDFRVAQDRAVKVDKARQGRFVQARALARFLTLRFPDGETIAAHKIGVIGYFFDNPIIDLSGRADPVISRAPRRDLRVPGEPARSDIEGAIERAPVAFVHPRTMVGKRQGRIRIPPWYPESFGESYVTVAFSSRKHWELTDGEQIWLYFFLKRGLESVPDKLKKP